jgi:hypothetical protein
VDATISCALLVSAGDRYCGSFASTPGSANEFDRRDSDVSIDP